MTPARILIVEDEAILAEDLVDRIERMGLIVAGVAASADEAAARARETSPDLVLMDVRLKGGSDGIEAAVDIRRGLDVPVVFLTAHSDPATVVRAKAAAPVGYLIKPFTTQELNVTIEIALQRHTTERMTRRMLEAQKFESLGRVAAGVAHDFSNLLTPILCNASLAAMDVDPSSSLGRYLASINTAADKAADLCRQMLAYSGRGTLDMRRVGINSGIAAVREVLRAALPRRIELSFDLADGLPDVDVDTTQVHQLLMNLLLNAAEAIEARGSVLVRTTAVDLEAASSGPMVSAGPYVVLEVSDDGAGMSDETRARCFEPFYTTKFIGRGLGLATAQGIARGHRGDISVESEPARGSTFRVYLPAVPRTSVQPPITIS